MTQGKKLPLEKKNQLKIQFLKALQQSRGIIYAACLMSKVTRSMHEDWVSEDEEYRKEVSSIKQAKLEYVESKLDKLIDKGNERAIMFFLQTQGRRLGWGKEPEVQVNVQNNTINTVSKVTEWYKEHEEHETTSSTQ